MIRSIRIKNYKSIVDTTIELGRLNVFIGENGCGKTNILEAVAMAGASISGRMGNEDLFGRGVRVARPSITLSAFRDQPLPSLIEIACGLDGTPDQSKMEEVTFAIQAKTPSGIVASWQSETVRNTLDDPNPRFTELLSTVNERDAARRSESLVHLGLKQLSDAYRELNQFVASNFGAKKRLGSLTNFVLYNLSTNALRGLLPLSQKEPLGIYGENLDVVIASLDETERAELLTRAKLISWVDDVVVDPEDRLKFQGFKLGRSTSTLYFRDRFMADEHNVFSAENANEGVLHVLFYLTLFLCKSTPEMFGIDNIETALNPRLCRELVKDLAVLANTHNKQALVTTHNPAILDGLNLHDDTQRLFVVYRDDDGHTTTRRVKMKPAADGERRMLSELWMRGHLGALPTGF